MSQITVKDGAGADQTVAAVDNTGTAAATDSLPVTLSTEDKAVLADIQAAVEAPPLATDAATETTLAAAGTTIGATADAAVTAGATGTLSAKLRSISRDIAALIAQIPATLGIKTAANSLSVAPASDAAFRAGAPLVSSVVIVSLQTNATGTTYNAFGSQACTGLDIVNTQPTAVDLEVRRGGSGSTIIVPAGASRMFVGITNASDLQVRRQDTSNTQITFTAEALA